MAGGKLVVISAPSGSGKTTIAKEVMKLNPSLGFSVSATTRTKRKEEIDGRDYFFLSREEFEKRKSVGDFIEWEELYGNLYGTLKSEIDRELSLGRHILFDVDVKGGLAIKRQYHEACLIFISPPSTEILRKRLEGRMTEDEETLKRRMDRVAMEMDLGNVFDHQVVNDNLAVAIDTVHQIVKNHLQ